MKSNVVTIDATENTRSTTMMNLAIINHNTTVKSQAPDVMIDLGRKSALTIENLKASIHIAMTTPNHDFPE